MRSSRVSGISHISRHSPLASWPRSPEPSQGSWAGESSGSGPAHRPLRTREAFTPRGMYLRRRPLTANVRKSDLLRRPVRDIGLGRKGIASLIDEMEAAGGFSGKKVAVGVDILRTMFRDPKCVSFLLFSSALFSARGLSVF